jgi:hypothetical protein
MTPLLKKNLAIIARKDVTRKQLDQALKAIKPLKAEERPIYWVTIINDSTYKAYHRERCLAEYFRRHVQAGITVAQLGRKDDIRNWFDHESVFDASIAALPATSGKHGGSRYMLQPVFTQRGMNPVSIFFETSISVTLDQFLDLIHGKKRNNKVLVAEIGISDEECD